jgi:hypothetical protein
LNAGTDGEGTGEARIAPGAAIQVSLLVSTLAHAITFNLGMWLLFLMIAATGRPAIGRVRAHLIDLLLWLFLLLPPIAATAVTVYRATGVPAGKRFRHGCLAALAGWPLSALAFVVVDLAIMRFHLVSTIGKESLVAMFVSGVGFVTSPVVGMIAVVAGRARDSRRVDAHD